ncbi:MAG: hypothetical protein Q4E35_00215 [Eubacteriales bacterium]|nr:hypothetical protein [Eubacteriales bacterium]
MQFDLKGHLNSINLTVSKALWPLFEAVVNSIQSIEDSPNKSRGKITIQAEREPYVQNKLAQKEVLGRFESFAITDNGIGFNEDNFNSFQTACSTYKIQKGCKGLGRFLWLKAFDSVEVISTFYEDNSFYKREFNFTAEEGITPENGNKEAADTTEYQTTVKLNGFLSKYRNETPVELEVIAKRIIEHCLPFFVSNQCPEIILSDNYSPTINLNQYFNANVKDSLHQDHFKIKDMDFVIYHLRLPEGADAHKLHLCANMQEVESFELKKFIPDLHRKIIPIDEPTGFFYIGYVSGQYLDSIVNPTRTGFVFDETDNQITISGTGKDTIVSSALEYIQAYLSDYLEDVKKKKREQIDNFVAYNKPTYRYLLHTKPDVYDAIPAGLRNDDLELELHKQVQAWETDILKQGKKLEQAAKDAVSISDVSYQEMFNTYWSNVTELSKTCLAEYVTRRKAILTMLEDALEIQDDGKFKKEDGIHSIICPMRHTSDDVSFEEMNLWIVDERLAYHKYLASDKTLKSMPVINSDRTKEPDIAIFDHAFAYSDSDEPFSTITIVEFKKPDNDSKNPVNQVGEYVDLIRGGNKKKANGQSFSVNEGTMFRCYIICDLTDKMRTHCLNSSLIPTPDNAGYTGYNQFRHEYIEVISYNKLLADAKKRNQILFDKLFAPKPNEIIHIPEE